MTIAPPPVATTTSTIRMSSLVFSTEPTLIVWIRSSGPPCFLTIFMNSLVTNSVHFCAFGCGAKITAFPVLSANIPLHIGVTIGFVTGVTAPTMPIGFATSVSPVSGSSPMTPRDFLSLRLFQMTRALPFFLRILSS